MALFINVDPVPARWYWRKVNRGYQFGYSGGTENDFVIDIEIAKWRFVCFIGFKYVRNPSPRQARHEQWRKEQEDARKRPNKLESAFKRLLPGWRNQAACHRVGAQHPGDHDPHPFTRFVMARIHQLRFKHAPAHGNDQAGRELAARHDLPSAVRGDAITPQQRLLLHQKHQRQSSINNDPKNSIVVELPKGE